MPKVYNKYHGDAPKDAVYIGRPSKWGNRHVVGDCPHCKKGHSRYEAIDAFYDEVTTNDQLIQNIKKELKGKNLVCFCAPKPCHGDVLLRIANE
jgi:hypothetical protein